MPTFPFSPLPDRKAHFYHSWRLRSLGVFSGHATEAALTATLPAGGNWEGKMEEILSQNGTNAIGCWTLHLPRSCTSIVMLTTTLWHSTMPTFPFSPLPDRKAHFYHSWRLRSLGVFSGHATEAALTATLPNWPFETPTVPICLRAWGRRTWWAARVGSGRVV